MNKSPGMTRYDYHEVIRYKSRSTEARVRPVYKLGGGGTSAGLEDERTP